MAGRSNMADDGAQPRSPAPPQATPCARLHSQQGVEINDGGAAELAKIRAAWRPLRLGPGTVWRRHVARVPRGRPAEYGALPSSARPPDIGTGRSHHIVSWPTMDPSHEEGWSRAVDDYRPRHRREPP